MNKKLLAGMQCECGSHSPFKITVMTIVTMHDDGPDRVSSDLVFDSNSCCICSVCRKAGKVEDFLKTSALPSILSSPV